MSLESELFQYLWADFNTNDFENWLYNQDSINFEKLIGKETYLDIISTDYSLLRPNQIKRYIYDRLDNDLKKNWDNFVLEKYIPIIGICKTKEALDYYTDNIRDWELEVGLKYEIIEIIKASRKNDNHKQYVRYVERDRDLYPSGLIPMDVFDINLDSISDIYLVQSFGGLIEIRPKDWSEGIYQPSEYSFWEDFYNDEPKAVKTYYDTITKLGIKNAW